MDCHVVWLKCTYRYAAIAATLWTWHLEIATQEIGTILLFAGAGILQCAHAICTRTQAKSSGCRGENVSKGINEDRGRDEPAYLGNGTGGAMLALGCICMVLCIDMPPIVPIPMAPRFG